MPFTGFVTADSSGRYSKIENGLGGVIYKDSLTKILRTLMLGLYSQHSKLKSKIFEIINNVEDKSILFGSVIPTLIDFMGVEVEQKTQRIIQEFFIGFLKKAAVSQKMQTIQMALQHPSAEVKLKMLNVMSEMGNQALEPLDSKTTDLLCRLQDDPKDRCQLAARSVLKKMKMDQRKTSPVKEPGKQAKPTYSQRHDKETGEAKRILKQAFGENGDPNERIKALNKLQRTLGGHNWNDYATPLRKALQDTNPEIVAKACEIINLSINHNKNGLEKQINEFIQLLIGHLSSLSEKVSSLAFTTLKDIVNLHKKNTVLENIFYNITSNSEKIRRLMGELTIQALESWTKEELQVCMLSLEKVMREGIMDKDPETRAQWRRALLKFSTYFEKRAEAIFISMDEKMITEESMHGTEIEITLKELHITNVQKMSEGVNSTVVRGNMFCRGVAIRLIQSSNTQRIDKEASGFELTKTSHHFTPLIGKIQTQNRMGFVMPLFHMNLKEIMGKNLKETLRIDVIYQIVQGIKELHDAGFTHNSLYPDQILINISTEDIEARIRNFWRSSVAGDEPLIEPRHGWSDPENLLPSLNCSKESDLKAIGLLSFYVWSDGKDPCSIFMEGLDMEHNLKIANSKHGKNFIEWLLRNGEHEDIPLPSAKLAKVYPVFWRKNSFPFFVDRLRECFLRNNIQTDEALIWKEMVPPQVMEFMELKKESGRKYREGLSELVNFLRNLSVHGRQEAETRIITGLHNENLERWFEVNFDGGVARLFEFTSHYFDDQFYMELNSITIK